mgnify:CR=1 FL=1
MNYTTGLVRHPLLVPLYLANPAILVLSTFSFHLGGEVLRSWAQKHLSLCEGVDAESHG